MLKFIKEWFWDIDEAPERIGWIGGVILAVFLAFCAYMWFAYGGRS